MKSEIKTLLGFAQRAGKVISGEVATRIQLSKRRKRRLKLLILAEDTAPEVQRQYMALAQKQGVAMLVAGRKEELGLAIGKSPRAIVGIWDEHFARLIIEKARETSTGPEI
ncbi:hypothetical protein SY88_06300 [Clostridiales bacterium PH28_bin88]|nr:hypothetical protein SY88_06300 [Clostridiales bacterium PH28_bin88]